MEYTKPKLRSISSLKLFDRTGWVIKARVVGKSCTERCYYDSQGDNHPWFTMGLCDHSGEIRAFAFDEICQDFYNVFQVNKLYFISGGLVKSACKEQNNMNNVYDLQLNEDTQVQECEDISLLELPKIQFNFMPLKKVYKLDMGTYVDVIGVCISDSGILRRDPLILREITLLDWTRRPITVVLWENDAEVFNSQGNPVIAIKGAGVSRFQDRRQLRCPIGVIMDPPIEKAKELRAWFKEDCIRSILNFAGEVYIGEEEDDDDY